MVSGAMHVACLTSEPPKQGGFESFGGLCVTETEVLTVSGRLAAECAGISCPRLARAQWRRAYGLAGTAEKSVEDRGRAAKRRPAAEAEEAPPKPSYAF